MRSGREIRAIVENARTLGGTSKSNTYDMLLDDNDDLVSHSQTLGGGKP